MCDGRADWRDCSPQFGTKIEARDQSALRLRIRQNRHGPSTVRLFACVGHAPARGLAGRKKACLSAVPARGLATTHEGQALAKRISLQRGRVVPATGPNQNWSMDFVHDQMSGGRAFRILTVIRAVESRECDSRGQLSPNRSMRRTGFGPGRLDARLTKDNHRGQRY